MSSPAWGSSRILGTLFFILSIWASGFVAIRVALHTFAPIDLAFVRFAIASIFLYCLMRLHGPVKWPAKADSLSFLALGLFGVALYHVCLNTGEITLEAATASFLIATGPLFSLILARFVLKESLKSTQILGMLVSFGGVYSICQGQQGFDIYNLMAHTGSLLVLVSAFASAINLVLQKKLSVRYSGLELAFYGALSGTLWLGLVFSWTWPEKVDFKAGFCLLYLAIVPAGIGSILWGQVLRQITAVQAAGSLYLIPFLTLLIGWHVLGEVPSFMALLGGILILCGVFISTR